MTLVAEYRSEIAVRRVNQRRDAIGASGVVSSVHCRDRLRARAVLYSDTATAADQNAKPATPKKNQVASVIGQDLSGPADER
jgi:hypothetical protein